MLKELASTREYMLARWKGIRVGRSRDKFIGKTLSPGEWTDLILGRVRLEEEYGALKQYTWKSGTLDAEDTTWLRSCTLHIRGTTQDNHSSA
jgi:hypothetical protein